MITTLYLLSYDRMPFLAHEKCTGAALRLDLTSAL